MGVSEKVKVKQNRNYLLPLTGLNTNNWCYKKQVALSVFKTFWYVGQLTFIVTGPLSSIWKPPRRSKAALHSGLKWILKAEEIISWMEKNKWDQKEKGNTIRLFRESIGDSQGAIVVQMIRLVLIKDDVSFCNYQNCFRLWSVWSLGPRTSQSRKWSMLTRMVRWN